MNQTRKLPMVVSVLNRLLQTLSRSLGLYTEEVKPWSLASHEPAWIAVGRLAADNRMYAARVAEAILEQGGQPHPGTYPLGFATLNDLGLEFFLREIIVHLKRDLTVINQCAGDLAALPTAHALAEEIHGNLQGHMEQLEKLTAELKVPFAERD